METSFDGMRRNATNSMNKLWDILKTVMDKETYQEIDDDLKEEITKAFNNAAQSVDVMNCLYDPNVENDINDLSDVLSINRLDEI